MKTALEKNDRQAFANKMSKYIPEQSQKCLNLKPSRETSEYLKKWSRSDAIHCGGGASKLT